MFTDVHQQWTNFEPQIRGSYRSIFTKEVWGGFIQTLFKVCLPD